MNKFNKEIKNFEDNYNEENDDELNGLYSHYNIVKKTRTLTIEKIQNLLNIENFGEKLQ